MEFEDAYGDSIYCLPCNAVCEVTGEHPEDMFACPLLMFDLWGDVCCPELCQYYDER